MPNTTLTDSLQALRFMVKIETAADYDRPELVAELVALGWVTPTGTALTPAGRDVLIDALIAGSEVLDYRSTWLPL